MTKVTEKAYGKLKILDGKIDVTDPCYDKSIFDRMDGISVVPGAYNCVAWKEDEGWGERVFVIGIYLNEVPKQEKMQEIGFIGVDAGLAGFFIDKPDYTDSEWEEFCDGLDVDNNDVWLRDNAFFSESGYGDGVYIVYGHDIGNGYDALEIAFV